MSVSYGGTGTSNAPTFGQLLLGNGNGSYNLVATSSLGILSGSSLLSSANTWTGLNLFTAGASTTNFSNFGTAYFGGTATTTIDSAGDLTVGHSLTANGNVTLGNATSTNLFSTTASSTNLSAQDAAIGTLSTPGLPNLTASVEGTGDPGLDGAHWFIWNDPATFDPTATLRVDRHADVGSGVSGDTYDAIWANASSGANNAGYEWAY